MHHHSKVAVMVLALIGTGLASSVSHAQLIVAHRGASYDAPENTLAAFRLAWEQQADAIEGDFYLTKDNQIVCIHDKTTKRVAPNQPELSVKDTTLEQLQSCDVGAWKHSRYAGERIPTLMDVLKIVPTDKKILVEIKCGPEIVPVLKPQLESSGLAPDQIVIICFNQAVVAQSRKAMPQYKVNWLTSYKQNNDNGAWTPGSDEIVRTLAATGATGLGSKGELKVIDQKLVNAVRQSNREFHVWTVNDPAAARTFQSFAVDSITTDRPAFIREVLGN